MYGDMCYPMAAFCQKILQIKPARTRIILIRVRRLHSVAAASLKKTSIITIWPACHAVAGAEAASQPNCMITHPGIPRGL